MAVKSHHCYLQKNETKEIDSKISIGGVFGNIMIQ
jgi:hypothetical protein